YARRCFDVQICKRLFDAMLLEGSTYLSAHLHIHASAHLQKICIFAHTHICTLTPMSLSDFFSPVDQKNILPKNGYYTSHLGSKIESFSINFPDIEGVDIAIIGVQEDRNAIN